MAAMLSAKSGLLCRSNAVWASTIKCWTHQSGTNVARCPLLLNIPSKNNFLNASIPKSKLFQVRKNVPIFLGH
jgi:hypothetical protein